MGLIWRFLLLGAFVHKIFCASEVCLSEVCVRRAQRMLDGLDEDQDPCTDFTHFACGGRFLSDQTSGAEDSPDQYKRKQQAIDIYLKTTLEGETSQTWTRSEELAQTFYKTCKANWYTKTQGKALFNKLVETMGADHLDTYDVDVDMKKSPKSLGRKLRLLRTQYGVQLSPYISKMVVNGTCMSLITDGGDYTSDDEDDSLASWTSLNLVNDEMHKAKELSDKFTELVGKHCHHKNKSTIRKITVKELCSLAPSFSWSEFLGVPRNSDQYMLISECVIKLSKAMGDEAKLYPMKTKTMLITRALRRLWKLVKEDKSDLCLDWTKSYFGDALTKLYLRKYPIDISGAYAMLDSVRDALRSRIEDADWIDNSTKKEFINRIDTIEIYAGYNDVVKKDETLDSRYFTLRIDDEDMVANLQAVARWYYKTLDRDCSAEIWHQVSPLGIDVKYVAQYNALVAPVALMDGTEYNPAQPSLLNYGNLGLLLGQSLMFTLSKDTRSVDRWGYPIEISNQTKELMANGDQCFVDHYNDVLGKENNYNDENGDEADIDRHFTEIFGLKLSYEAWIADNGTMAEQLPGTSKYTPEQQFFIAYAQAYCNNEESNPENGLSGQVRTWSTMSQVKEAGEAFNCKVGTQINPTSEDRCNLW